MNSRDSLKTTTDRLAAEIRDIMVSAGKTLCTAESCTSGAIAAALTSVSGASAYFQGGLVAYQDRIKTEKLGVDAATIESCDVVSREVVTQMVIGACRMFDTDCAIASTGYADKGNGRIPSGTIWLGWGCADDVHVLCLTKDNGRSENTTAAVIQALQSFRDYINLGKR